MTTLGITPLADGSLDVTAGDTLGAAWTLEALPGSAVASGGFQVVGGGVGDGTANLAFQPAFMSGGYFAILRTATDVSRPAYFVAPQTDDDPWYQCLTSIAARITAMGLDGMDPRRIQVYKIPLDKNIEKILAAAQKQDVKDGSPTLIVAPVTERRSANQANLNIRTLYGCGVYFWQASLGDPEKNLAQQLLWRNRVTRDFHEQPFPGVNQVIKSTVEPGQVFPLETFKLQYDMQSLIVRCESCERKVA